MKKLKSKNYALAEKVESKKTPLLFKEGWQSLRLTGCFSHFMIIQVYETFATTPRLKPHPSFDKEGIFLINLHTEIFDQKAVDIGCFFDLFGGRFAGAVSGFCFDAN